MSKMKFALFLGCNIPARVQQYESSARAVLTKLNVALVDIREFACCGYPMRNADMKTAWLSSAWNLALAEQQGLDVITLCQCCFGALKKTAHLLSLDEKFREEVNAFLAPKNLNCQGKAQVKHLLSVLYKDIGEDAIKETVKSPFKNLNIASHYGCHALRPSDVMQFDDPVAPVILDRLVALTGAKSVDWPKRLECCGAPLLGVNDDLSMRLTADKLAGAKANGANYLGVACPWCHLQFDGVQKRMEAEGRSSAALPSVLYTQLLGLAMGIPADDLGLSRNEMDLKGILAFIAQAE